ncbi:MAG TPA: MBL fold metallo-hydrolase [Candidatus Thermoplasmatota archaeon]|nr:MBL fold metallo-hydrolase [Candidatus Thermoplasmatota archaeon]
MTELTFLGTGGGRFTTISQLRQTGGIYIRDRGLKAHIDPGPGALLHLHRYGLDPTATHAVLVSHAHPDHWTDAAILLEGITRGGLDRKGALVAPRSVLRGAPLPDGKTIGPVITRYHQDMMAESHEVKPGSTATLEGMYELLATRQEHSDPDTVGFRLRLTHGPVSYIPDTQYFDGLCDPHKGSRLVVCQMTRGGSDRIPWHMCTDDVERLAAEIRPRLLLLTHFGYKTLKEGDPGKWAQQVTERTGVPTVAARDGLRVTMGSEFSMELLEPQPAAGRVLPAGLEAMA